MTKNWQSLAIGAIVIIVVVLALRQLLPSSQSHHPNQASQTITFDGVSFSYRDLASSVSAQLVSAEAYVQPQPGGSGNPPYLRFAFDGEDPATMGPPTGKYVLVYPVAEYQKLLSQNNFGQDWSANTLQQIIEQQPENPQNIPTVPVPYAEQVMRSKIEYPEFVNGRGVRFITSYAQNIAPITNDDLLYTFQGLTTDGKYWVAVYYPVTSEILPATYQSANIDDYNAFAENFNTYLTQTVANLNAQPNNKFTPNLDDLDALVKSLNVQPTGDI